MTNQLKFIYLTLSLLLFAGVSSITAATSADQERIQDLEKTVKELQEQNQKILLLLEQLQATKSKEPVLPTNSGPSMVAKPSTLPTSDGEKAVKTTTLGDTDLRFYWKNGVNIESGDKKTFKGKLGGRVHFDTAFFSQDANVRSNVGDAPAGARFRRARLAFSGKVDAGIPTHFKNQIDFADGGVTLKDVFAGISDIPVIGSLQIGNFHEPFSLEELTSSRYITFIERASPITTFGADRNVGVMAQKNFLKDDRALWSVGFFTDTGGSGRGSLDSDVRLTARLSGLPWYDAESGGRRYLHLGGSVVAANSQDDMERFRTRPEISLAPNYVDTGAYAADSAFYSHLEALLTMGSLSFQSELFHTYTDTIVGPDASFDALYLQGSWMLTGEHRPYNKKLGAAGRLIPNRNFSFRDHGSGAWELALRYSRTDLNGGLINGGRLSDITAGVNWYISPTLRAMVNYIHSHLDRNGLEGNSHIISSRVSIDF